MKEVTNKNIKVKDKKEKQGVDVRHRMLEHIMSHRVTQIWEEIRVQRIERSEKSPTYVNLIYDKINTLSSGQRINCLIKYSEIINILLREKKLLKFTSYYIPK